MSSPEERPQASMYRARDRRLWGEVETEGPPRWNHARRRSSLAPAPTMLPEAMPDMSARNGSGSVQEEQAPKQPPRIRHEREPAVYPSGQRPLDPWELRTRLQASHPRNLTSPPRARPPTQFRATDDPRARHQANTDHDADLAYRLLARQEAAARRRAQHQARRQHDEEELSRRISELEELEALDEMQERASLVRRPHQASSRHQQPPALALLREQRQAFLDQRAGIRRQPGTWAPEDLAQAVMGMLNNEGALANTHYSALSQHVAAVRHAMGVIQGPGRLPAHLLFSDRDFNENDYEALLALDDNVVSRKGASPEEIESIPTVVFSRGRRGTDTDCRCPICLEDIQPGDLLRKISCKHSFHKDCLDKWLSQKSACPICQQQP